MGGSGGSQGGLGGSGGSQEASGGPRRLRGVLGGLGGSQKASGGLGKIWPPQASGPPRTLGECHSAMRQAFFVCDNPQMKGRLSFRSHFGSSILVSGSFCDRFKPGSFRFFTGLIDTAWRCDAQGRLQRRCQVYTVAYPRRGYTTLLLILTRDINTVAYLHAGDMHNTVAYPPRRGYINTVAYLALHLQSTSSALGCGLEPKVG